MALLRDMMILDADGVSASSLVNPDLAGRLKGLATLGRDKLPDLVEQLDMTISGIRRMGNRQLLVENFLMSVATRSDQHAPYHPS